MLKYVKAIGYTLLYILLFMLFRQQIGDMLWEANNKWFADCDTVYGGVLIIAICGFVIASLLGKYRHCIFGHHLLSVCLTVLFLYVFYRWVDDTFCFWGIIIPWTNIYVSYVDCAILVAVVVIGQQWYAHKEAKRVECSHREDSLLMKDDPIKRIDEDILGYSGIVDLLLSDLEGIKLEDGSFSIGITGEWGMGKSSLFTIVAEKLKNNKKAVVYSFNPRASASIEDIQQDFFDGLTSVLTPFHSGVNRVIRHYQVALQIIEGNWFMKLFSLFTTWSVAMGKERMNEIIKETHKRIFVLVDDLDRLTAPEILEVMKLVDRNGDFVNTIFITAYDKAYVNDVLRHHLGMGQESDFTDKYFSYEFALPVQNPNNLNKLARKQIEGSIVFDESDAISKNDLLKQWSEISAEITMHLHSLRHVKRFMNILLTRYNKVKNDVYFKDFAYLTLLRYKDIGVYNAIIEGKLIVRGSKTTDTNDKLYYLKEKYEEDLNGLAKWDGSVSVLKVLFENINDIDPQILNVYQKLRFVNSLPNYYYDFKPGDIYYRDMIQLYQVKNDDEAIALMKELLLYDDEKKDYSRVRYESVADFLTQRPLYMLKSLPEMKRLVFLLATLMRYTWISVEVESSISSMLNKAVGKLFENSGIAGNDEEYRIELEDAIENAIKSYPREMASVLLKVNYSIIHFPESIGNYLINPKQITNWAEWCQKLYIRGVEENNLESIATIVDISKIYDVDDDQQVTKSAQTEFIAYITEHSKYFATYICSIFKPSDNDRQIIITYTNDFNPSLFFPYNGMGFSQWISENIENHSLKHLLLTVEKSKSNQVVIDLLPEDHYVNEENYDAVWNVLVHRQEKEEEEKVLEAIKNHIALSYTVISKDSGLNKKKVKRAIFRLVKKNKLEERMNDLADSIPPFEVGDFVMYKEFDKVKQKIGDYHSHNVFKILDIEDGKYKLGNIEGKVDVKEIEAIPIDGVHDRSIYYDPIVAASIIPPGGSVPVHRTDYSYYMDKFENCLDVDKHTYAEVVKERGYHFVHEVQHWLNDEFDRDGLKSRW